ncbi:MAG: YdcF family protein, partial [Elusimicrobia bacterium]|nr:YdcF family protein [Elusimicrobiota bacterium]
SAAQAVPLGLLGLWRFFPRMSVGRASLLEAVGFLAIAAAVFGMMMTSPTIVASIPTGDFLLIAQLAARITIISGIVLFPIVIFSHLVFGVLQPNRRAIFNAFLAVRAGAVAISSFFGLPILIFAGLAWHGGLDMKFIGYVPLILLGIVIGAVAHRLINVKLLEFWFSRHRKERVDPELSLIDDFREELVQDSQPVLNFLGERTRTEVTGETLQQLRDRTVARLPDGAVTDFDFNFDETDVTKIPKVESLIVLGSHYLDVPTRAAELYMHLRRNPENRNMVVVFAGGMGPRTRLRFPYAYWSSEAELFRDNFVSTVRSIRRQELERRFSSVASEFMGRYTELFVQIAMLIDDVFFGYRASLPKTILMDTQSKDTGSNVANVAKLFERRGLAPQSVALVTDQVFQLRARATFLQQYPLPFSTLYSWSATETQVSTLPDPQLVEKAAEAVGQMDRLRDYAAQKPPFTVPVQAILPNRQDAVPTAVVDATGQTRRRLRGSNLMEVANGTGVTTNHPTYPSAYATALTAGIVLITLLAALPLGGPAAGWMEMYIIASRVSTGLVMATLAAVAAYIVLFSPTAMPFQPKSKALAITLGVLRWTIPPVIGLALAFGSILAFEGWPVWVSVLSSLVVGGIVRAWMRSVERHRRRADAARAPVPGAAGVWARSGMSLWKAGAIEGVLTVVAALAVMGLVMAAPLVVGHVPQVSPAELWGILTAAATAVGFAGIKFVHSATGVTL